MDGYSDKTVYGCACLGVISDSSTLPYPPQTGGRTDHLVIEQDFHSVVSQLELELRPLVEAERSVLVDILYQPHRLFRKGSEAESTCQRQSGGFISRCVSRSYHLQAVWNRSKWLCLFNIFFKL